MTKSIELNTIQYALKKNLEKYIGYSVNDSTVALIHKSVHEYLNYLEKGIDMNQVKFVIELDKNAGVVHIVPENEYTAAVFKFLATSPKIP